MMFASAAGFAVLAAVIAAFGTRLLTARPSPADLDQPSEKGS
ncbi:hypothetical protein AB0I81_00160 [Nonomuraea sp. NPDC050404]